MKDFSSFLEDVKQNRDGEIRSVVSKGYSCDAKSYKFFDYFSIDWFDNLFNMSLFCNNSETNFLVVEDVVDEDESAIKRRSRYYSMVNLFDDILSADKESVFLQAISLNEKTTINISYKSNIYSLEIPTISKKAFKKIYKSNKHLLSLILVFCLIQNKSNSIFKNNKDYIDGIYRFFQVYSNVKYDVKPMKKRGWNYVDGKFKYKPYLEMKLIRLVYRGKTMMKEENAFAKQLKQATSNDDALVLFLNEYNRMNKCSIGVEDIYKAGLFDCTSDDFDEKEADSCDSIKQYKNNNDDRCYRFKGLAIGINTIAHHFMILKLNKKYYLTNSELNEIINNDPSESSIDDRSGGSNSL